jgi:hypothetical protein
LDELPNLAELTDLDKLAPQLDLDESEDRFQGQTSAESEQDEDAQGDTTVQHEPVVMALPPSNTQH